MRGPAQAPGLCQERRAPPPSASQNPVNAHSDAPFGNELRSLKPGVGRILLQNPNGLGMKRSSMKQSRLKSSIIKHDFGIVGLSEIGVNWNRIEQKDGWWSRTHEWFQALRSSKSYNTTDPSMGRAQSGGTITMARDRYAHCTDRLSFDPRHLGRWSSIRLQGKGSIRTRIVTVYCPCPSSVDHPYSAYNQQLRGLAQANIHKCPRLVFWEDLLAELEAWKSAGEQLIVMGDWNHPISVVQEKLAPLGLADAILSLHNDVPSPATHNRGSNTIDGIFVTASLQAISGGFCMFNTMLLSDHRALWIEIPLTSLLGFEMPNIVTPSARRLKLNDPRVVKKYFAFLEQYLFENDLFNRTAILVSKTVFPLPDHLAAEYEIIHSLCTEGMILAERQCRQLYRGVHPWSVEFATAQSAVVFWTLCTQKLLGIKIDTKKMLRIGKRLGLLPDLSLSVAEAYIAKDKAWETYKETKGNSTDLRHGFLDLLASAQAEANNISKESAIKSLRAQEDQRRASRAVKKATGKLTIGSTSRVLTCDESGNPVEITDRVPMEKVMADVSETKFHASEKYCPIMSGQLFKDIGSLGFGPRVSDILDGTYIPPEGTPEGTRLFLKHMARPFLTVPIPEHSLAAFRKRWKSRKERTSSSSKLHVGHYKAGCSHDLIGWLLFNLAEIPFISGYAPTAWQEGVDVVILKAANDYRIEKMRTIVLYHPEFNMNNKRLGWEAMNVAISNNQLAVEQYSRPGRSAIDHVVNRQLSFNQFIYQRKPFGVCSCDLTGCYDRVVHSAISLAMQRLGFPPGAIKSQFSNIQKLVHRVRTAFGDSELTYGGNTWKNFYLHPPQGFGQGNTFGPPGFSILSSTIFAVLKDEGYGVKFCSALSREVFELCGFAYVDDADLLQTGTSPAEVNRNLQKALSLWEGVINATGGAMAPTKSWWYSVDFLWKNGVYTLADGGKTGDIVAHDENGNKISLSYLMHHSATKMLGVWLAPDGSHTKQIATMKSKAMDWADYIRTGHLSASDTWIALSSTIWRTLEYPLAALMLSDDDLTSIVWPIISVVLPKMGMTRCLPRALRYGPLEAGGVGIRDLYMVMGMSRIQYLLEHPWKNTPTGHLIRSNWESITLESGLFGPLAEADFPSLSKWLLTSSTWVRSTLQFLHEEKVSFHSNLSFYTLAPKRLRDSPIMSGLSRVVESSAALRRLNQCRIFLKVVSVADISTTDGTTISDSLFGTTRELPYRTCRRNTFAWPGQDRPPRTDWTFWKESIKSAFCSTNWSLTTSLGDWTVSQDEYIADWDYFLCPSSPLSLYVYSGTYWGTFRRAPVRSSSRSAAFFYPRCACAQPELSTLRRTTIIRRGPATFSVEHFSELDSILEPWDDPVTPPQNDLDKLLFYLHSCKEFSWLATTFSTSSAIDKLLEDFIAGRLLSVSDGSFNPDTGAGAAGWCVESIDGTQFIRGGGRVCGSGTSQSAYRSELTGLLGISMVLWALEQTLDNRVHAELIVACDGISALFKSIHSDKERLYTRDLHFDLLSAIIGFWSEMSAEAFPVHVKGHQDDSIEIVNLPRLARMNVKMDALAKAILKSSLSAHHAAPTASFTFGLPPITCRTVPIESSFAKSAVATVATIKAREYWIGKFKLSTRSAMSLNWTSFGRAFKSTAFARQIFLRKWLSQTVPVGTTLRKRKSGTNNRCPRCNCYEETTLHVLTCPNREASTHRLALLTALFSTIRDIDTCPLLADALESILSRWLHRPRGFTIHACSIDTSVAACILSQDALGWYQFICGFHSLALVNYQRTFYTRKRSRKSAPYWASKLTRALWTFIHEMWAHRTLAKHSINELAPDAPEVSALRSAALLELAQGASSLPPLYRHYFNITTTSLLAMSNTDLRIWFKSVRIFREATSTSVVDVFSSPGPLRSWVGLGTAPTISSAYITTTTEE